jgi:hypothetical protein
VGELINILGQVRDSQIPEAIARDVEVESQYVKKISSFDSGAISPVTFTANTWQAIGSSMVFGEQGAPAFWDVVVYFEYVDSNNTTFPYFQYCGGASLAAIFWNADALTNEGVPVAFEAHIDPDFSARLRFGRGQSRKVELKIDRAISIVAPGFMQIKGVRKI